MKKICLALLALSLGGCLSDADTANNRSVLPAAAAPSQKVRDKDDSDQPRQLCESTVEGNDTKMVCY